MFLEKVNMLIVLLALHISTSKTQKNKLSDEEVVALIVEAQNPRMVDVLYNRYADKVYRKCLSFVKDQGIAEDLTHDIFIRIYMNLGSFKGKAKFSTWLYAITYNFCVDYLRKNKKYKYINIEDEQRIVDTMSVETIDDLADIKASRLGRLLKEMKKEERMILIMKYQDGLSIKDIRDVLKISESAVKMRIKRAKEKVRRLHNQYYT